MLRPKGLRALPARIAALAGAVLLLGVTLSWTGVGSADAVTKTAFTITDSRITESSGLTRDVPGDRYWTINDSGDSGRAFAISTSGKTLGVLNYRATPTDVEAVAYRGGYLYIGDIGDNNAKRQTITVYRIYNPQPNGQQSSFNAYDFTYPDGPRDAEALLISRTGRIYVISKEADGGVYEAPAQPSHLRANRLTRIADAPSFVTDGLFLPDGDIAVRTYVSVQILDPKTYKVIAQAPTPAEPQGESLALNLAGDALLVGSEGKKQPVYQLPVPTAVQKVPTAGASPGTPSASASASAQSGSDSSADGPDDTSSGSSFGLTLLVAGAVAVVAGLVTFGVRTRT